MNQKWFAGSRKWLILPPVALGIAILMFMSAGKQPPAEAERGEPKRTVRVIEVPMVELRPKAEGFGPIEPARVWTAVSQVAGRVTYIHPRLRDGEILQQGSELVRIDPTDYEIALAQSQAELMELDGKESNARASLEIEKRNLALAQKELERIRKLVKKGTTSKSLADETERTMLAYRASVQNHQNTLALVPAQRTLFEARIEQAERNLEHTVITAPFDMRVANLKVEAEQYVPIGQSLFEGDDIDRVEVKAQVAMSSLRRLFIGRERFQIEFARLNEEFADIIAINSIVQLDLGNHVAEWVADFVRFSDTVDPETRTMGVVVAVDEPFKKIIPGYKPPLSKGMFVKVVISAKQTMQRMIVPRSSVRGGNVFVVDEESRLRRRPVKIMFSQFDISVIEDGIEPGDRVVVSDIVPAVDGMLLDVVLDEALNASLREVGSDT